MAFEYGLASEAQHSKDSPSLWNTLLEHAIVLLVGLTVRREGVEQRPIVFVCHSFGAVILKKVVEFPVLSILRLAHSVDLQVGFAHCEGKPSVPLHSRKHGWHYIPGLPTRRKQSTFRRSLHQMCCRGIWDHEEDRVAEKSG